VTDFGLAKHIAPGSAAESDGGTIPYMPPEQTNGSVEVTSDVYGLGAILYELLTGQPPFTGATRSELIENVRHQELIAPRLRNPRLAPRDLEWICLKSLRKEPGQGYDSANKLVEDLEACRDDRALPNNPRPILWAAMRAAISRPFRFVLDVEPQKNFGRS